MSVYRMRFVLGRETQIYEGGASGHVQVRSTETRAEVSKSK